MLIITISTLFSRIDKIKSGQFPTDENIRYVVSCQGEKENSNTYYQSILTKLFGTDVIWGEELKSGLSNNRNNALKLAYDNFAKLDCFVYICDDDVTLILDGLLEATEIMRIKKLACLTGIITTKNGMFKNYQNCSYQHTKLNAAKVCSVEILVDLNFIINNQIYFDTQFGLGSKYPSGEEFIFMNDIITSGGKSFFYPIKICLHPPLSSGDDFYSNNNKIIAKGAMLKRVFPFPLYYIMIIFFSVKKHNEYKNSITFLQFFKKMLNGAADVNR